MDIAGNEKADEEAKRAALEQIAGEPLSHRKLKSVQVAKINEDIKMAAKKAWNSGKTNARQQRKMTRPQRFQTGVQLYGGLPRKQLANLIRLRTGHCRLNSTPTQHHRRPSLRLRTRPRKHETLPPIVWEVWRAKEQVEEEGGGEKHESGDPARWSKISTAHARICGEYRTV